MTVYLVSGDADIEPAGSNLKNNGRTVRLGMDVDLSAVNTLEVGGKFVVVAHGSENGTIYWRRENADASREWVWVGMNPAPHGSRIYFYCCKAGPEITHFLRDCDCFGHCDVVPMPVDSEVLEYLDEVDKLMEGEDFNAAEWRLALSEFVNANFSRELDAPTSVRAPCIWLMLSKSLGVSQ